MKRQKGFASKVRYIFFVFFFIYLDLSCFDLLLGFCAVIIISFLLLFFTYIGKYRIFTYSAHWMWNTTDLKCFCCFPKWSIRWRKSGFYCIPWVPKWFLWSMNDGSRFSKKASCRFSNKRYTSCDLTTTLVISWLKAFS